jgi:nitrite reductase/ring-hydroxylating ferredoxin subunit
VLERGSYLIVSNLAGQAEVLALAHRLIREGVEALEGPAARSEIESRGFGVLHEVLPPERIGALRDRVMPELRPALLALACRIGRDLLGIGGEFFVDDYTILRINYPYEVALRAPRSAENPGIGRTDDRTRREGKAAAVVDPVYDPRGYHRNEPPPAWAHGPHQDTWTGHSRHGVNLWWAVDDVPEEASMIFYPETFGRPFSPDPRSLYLREGYPLPRPTKMSLRRGEMLVFNPELLHGTHLNTAGVTRLALSTRINPGRPKFSPNCFYAREFWHSSANLEAGRFGEVLRFVRAENLEEPSATPEPATPAPPPPAPEAVTLEAPRDGEWASVCPADRLPVGGKLLVRVGGEEVIVMRGLNGLHAAQARCPHLGVSMMDGHHDDREVFCPAHGVAFSLADGRSSCELLRMRTYDVKERDGRVCLRLPAGGAHA